MKLVQIHSKRYFKETFELSTSTRFIWNISDNNGWPTSWSGLYGEIVELDEDGIITKAKNTKYIGDGLISQSCYTVLDKNDYPEMYLKLVIGDLYYKNIEHHSNNRTTGVGTVTYEDVFVRGVSFLKDFHGKNTLRTINDKTGVASRRLWETNTDWILLGPGEIEDYPEVLL